jgi:hypothetical protein
MDVPGDWEAADGGDPRFPPPRLWVMNREKDAGSGKEPRPKSPAWPATWATGPTGGFSSGRTRKGLREGD